MLNLFYIGYPIINTTFDCKEQFLSDFKHLGAEFVWLHSRLYLYKKTYVTKNKTTQQCRFVSLIFRVSHIVPNILFRIWDWLFEFEVDYCDYDIAYSEFKIDYSEFQIDYSEFE